jgi:hypothetical protein
MSHWRECLEQDPKTDHSILEIVMNARRPEPSLDDLLGDPIMHSLLARDGLTVDEVRRFLDEMKHRLRPLRCKAA